MLGCEGFFFQCLPKLTVSDMLHLNSFFTLRLVKYLRNSSFGFTLIKNSKKNYKKLF